MVFIGLGFLEFRTILLVQTNLTKWQIYFYYILRFHINNVQIGLSDLKDKWWLSEKNHKFLEYVQKGINIK